MRKALVGLVALAMFAGCGGQKPNWSGNSGSVATSTDGKLVYAVDHDNDAMEVVDATSLTKVNEIKVGRDPARIIVGSDDRIYITNRGERTVSVLAPQTFNELARIPVGVEPNGLALSTDGSTLFVVSATDLDDSTHGTVSAIDTKALTTSWTLKVGEEPRGIAVVGDKAYVTSLKKSTVTVVDLKQHQVSGGVDLSSNDDPTSPNAMNAGGVVDVTVSPDGQRVFAPHLWELSNSITGDRTLVGNGGGGGAYGASGPCGSGGSIVAAGVGTIVTADDSSKVDSLAECNDPSDSPTPTDPNTGDVKDFPPSLIPTGGNDGQIVQGPSAAVVDPTGLWLFMVNRNSNNVVIMPTRMRTLANSTGQTRVVVNVGAAPDGIAISRDGKTAFVYSQFDHNLAVLQQGKSITDIGETVNRIQLASDTLPADQVAGRRMFFDATKPSMTASSIGIACSSCHIEGREDGHVWVFPDGKRQTPSLAGRRISETAPYHWAGLFPTLNNFFTETIKGRMGGTGVTDAQAAQLTAFIENQPAAENPFQGRPDLLDSQQRGQLAFKKAGCTQCHTGESMQDNGLHDVGTLTSVGLTPDLLESLTVAGLEDDSSAFAPLKAVNTPSLLGLARTAPYLHDGSVSTIRGRIDQARNPRHDGRDHGDTSTLSDDEINDLEQYLVSL